MRKQLLIFILLPLLLLGFSDKQIHSSNKGAEIDQDSLFIAQHYDKYEYRIPMRDGVKLFTAVYVPKDKSKQYPIMLKRTPYAVKPYGPDQKMKKLGPSMLFAKEKFIFVYQDVRGRFMSEGEFENMRPHLKNKRDRKRDIDESTDTFDTIKWLLRKVKRHNGKVGMWGISYPGFYAIAGAINAHPALVAVSPQAPIADWYFDDFHHHGALFLPHSFNFLWRFDQPRKGPTTTWSKGRFDHGTPDGYRFFLEELGPLKNARNIYFGDSLKFWNAITEHPNYDEFWQARNILPHLQQINPAVLTVGGWFDAEDLYGPLNIYQEIEKNKPRSYNGLVMGPWSHGGWARTDGTYLGNVFFGDQSKPSQFYQENIEFPFFMHYLKDAPKHNLPEAYVFETGTNLWRKFDTWPPKDVLARKLYLHSDGMLEFSKPSEIYDEYDDFISDPSHPVPYTEEITTGMTKQYMTDDQRFAARRPDVLVYQTEPLAQDMTLAGPLLAKLFVATSGSDADWVIKLIDVYPDDHPPFKHQPNKKMGGYQQMVRSEVIRGRYRNSYEFPEPFSSGDINEVNLKLQDVLHNFKKGHRIMIQIQSTWFPLVDRNPQKFVPNIFNADEKDFIKSIHRVYRSQEYPSRIEILMY
ncbi:MAG: CocE/NonD family hydrolase [Flammeovirgaceae bacterium]